jgi:hypothetical protein
MAGGVYDPESNRTFATWGGKGMDPVVVQVDHDSGTLTGPVFAGEIPGEVTKWDYHNYPHMVMADDGHLLVFFANHNKTLYMARSAQPRSIEGTWRQMTVDLKGNKPGYPLPVKANNGDLYVFYRHTISGVNRPLHFTKSTDHGRTWQPPRPVIQHDPLRDDLMDEIYAGGIAHDPGTNRFVLNWTLAGGPLGHNKAHANIYMAYFDADTDTCISPGGVDLGPVIDNEESMTHCLVKKRKGNGYVTGHYSASAFLDDGTGLILFTILEGGRYTVYSGTWKENRFEVRPVGSTGARTYADAVCGLEKLGPREFRAYFMTADSENDRLYHIQSMRTTDGGLNWQEDTFFDFGTSVNQVQVIPNGHPEFRALVQELQWDRVYEGSKRVWKLGHTPRQGVRILHPESGAQVPEDAPVGIQVATTDPFHSVDLFMEGRSIASLEQPPYRTLLENPPLGRQTLTARTTGPDGRLSYSFPLPFQVGSALFHDTFSSDSAAWRSHGYNSVKGDAGAMIWESAGQGIMKKHDGGIRFASPQVKETTTQRALLVRDISPTDLQNTSWFSTGITSHPSTVIRLAVKTGDQWAVSDQKVHPMKNGSDPVDIEGRFSESHWFTLNTNLTLREPIQAEEVLKEVTAVGIWAEKSGSYMSNHLPQLNSFGIKR